MLNQLVLLASTGAAAHGQLYARLRSIALASGNALHGLQRLGETQIDPAQLQEATILGSGGGSGDGELPSPQRPATTPSVAFPTLAALHLPISGWARGIATSSHACSPEPGSGKGGQTRGPPPTSESSSSASSSRPDGPSNHLRRGHFSKGRNGYERQRYQKQYAQLASAVDERADGKRRDSAALFGQLRAVRNWKEFAEVLQRVPPHLLGPKLVSALLHTYTLLYTAEHRSAGGRGGGGGKSPAAVAPAAVTASVRDAFTDALPFVTLPQASLFLMSLARLPYNSPLTGGGGAAGNLLTPLLGRLEVLLLVPRHLDRVRGAAAAAQRRGAAGEGLYDWQSMDVGSCLSYLASGLRRLGQRAPPGLFQALAAAAGPCAGRGELAGEQLVIVISCFSQASNPDPHFMDAAIAAAARPAALAALTAPSFAATLLAAAVRAGITEPRVLAPIADRLVELMASGRKAAQQGQRGGGKKEKAAQAKGGSGGGGGGEAEGEGAAPRGLSGADMLMLVKACDAARYGQHGPLMEAILEEVRLNGGGWNLQTRLQLAHHLASLGFDVVTPPPDNASAAAPAAAGAPAAAATGPGAPAAPAATAPAGEPAAGGSATAQEQQQQAGGAVGRSDAVLETEHTQQQPQEAGRQEGEQEGQEQKGKQAKKKAAKQAGNQQPQQQQQQQQPTRGSLVREEEVQAHLSRPDLTLVDLINMLQCLARLRGPIAGPAHDADADARPLMPAALATAVQLIEVAAPLMPPLQARNSLAALTAAGLAPPLALLAQTQKLYHEHEAAVNAATANAAAKGAQDAATAAAAARKSLTSKTREVEGMCAAVGRLLSCHAPDAAAAAAAAAGLSDTFVQHCRTAALRH